MDKSIIEEPTLDLLELFDKVSTEAKREKLAVPPINKMMYYWTRKPLIVGRAVALASTLKDVKSVQALCGFSKDTRAYTRIPSVETFKKQIGKDPSKIKVLDPFGGSGSLIFEAKRLGFDCTCSDYNPLAHILEKSVLEFPVKYDENLGADFEKYANKVIEMTHNEIGQFYNKHDLVYFWTWCIMCPHCDQRVPLTNHMWLANTKQNKIAIKFNTTKDKNFTTDIIQNATKNDGNNFTQKRGKAICIRCKNAIDHATLVDGIKTKKNRELNAIKIIENNKSKYVAATAQDKKRFKDALEFLLLKKIEYEKMDLIPNEEIRPSHQNNLRPFGIVKQSEFFNERQTLILITLIKNIINVCDSIQDKEYAKTMSVYLGYMLIQHLNHNSIGTILNPKRENIAHSLSLRRPMLIHPHAEINPFAKTAGALGNMVRNIRKAIDFATKNTLSASVELNSVTQLDSKFDLIITDPPYGWDVQYGELSDFFYVWIYRCIKKYFPELPKLPSLEEDFCVSLCRFQNRDLAFDFFERGFKKSFLSISNALKDDGLLVVFFAHSGIDAWNILLESIRNARFRIVSSYAIHTESTANLIAHDKTAFMSSIVVVCRKITEEKTAYFEDIIPDTEDSVKKMIKEIPEEKFLTLPITDLLIMVYGKVLEICTEFTELKSYQKDTEPKLEEIIRNSQDYIVKEIIAKLMGRSVNLIDPKLAFYLLVKIFYNGKISSDDALKIIKAVATDIEKLEQNGVVQKQAGSLSLTPLHESNLDVKLDELDKSDIYQQLCYLCNICHEHDVGRIRAIISQSSRSLQVDELKKIVSLLIKSARLRISKNQTLSNSDREELGILEKISDVWGGKTIKGTMDGFV